MGTVAFQEESGLSPCSGIYLLLYFLVYVAIHLLTLKENLKFKICVSMFSWNELGRGGGLRSKPSKKTWTHQWGVS